ncbi:MAG: TonB-dependent receptor plug domain-containing protein [Anaerolineales bacterium]
MPALNLSAQDYGNITGFVFDENNGNPLVGANIYLNKTAIQTATTEDGNFVLENISAGTYEITISFLGYRNKNIKNIRVHEGFTSKLNIAMIPFPIPGDSVFVYGGDIPKSEIPLENKVILSSQDIKKFEKFGLPHLLQQVAGVQVESQGGSGGVSYLSIHGSKPREVLVLLDGQRLNNPQTGEVDLNSIPLSEIERIEIVRQGNAAAYGAGAFAGTIAFYTRDRVTSGYVRINSRFGSFQTSSGNISFGSKMKSMAVLGNYYQDYSLQNFEYNYEGKQILRENNWYRNQRIFGKVKLDLTRHQFSVMYNMRTGNRGLPSTYFDEFPSFNAKLNEKLTALQLQYRLLFSHKVYLETQIAQNQLQQSYRNLDAPIKQRYHNRQTNDVLESNIRLNVEQNNRLGYQLKLSYLKESLDQQNLLYPEGSIGEKSRESFAGFANIDYSLPNIFAVFKPTHLRSSIGYQKIFNYNGVI